MLESEEDYERFNIKPKDDAYVVKSIPATARIAEVVAEVGERLGDPKASLIHFIEKLADTPGLTFEFSTALKTAIEKMPRESFEVSAKPLNCQLHRHGDLPGQFTKALNQQEASQGLDYLVFNREAKRRLQEFGADDAIKAISSLVESNPGDLPLARDVAFSALAWERGGQAYSLLKRVASARPSEPQSYQALARCLTEIGNADLAMVYYDIILAGEWNERYGDIQQIVGVEYLQLLRQVAAKELATSVPDYAASRMAALEQKHDLCGSDLVVTMLWNTDRTDIDLHVNEPNGAECSYNNRETKNGGRITADVTQGYGPEMYVMRNAPAGDYKVWLHFFGSDGNRTSTRTKVYVTVYRNFGEENQTAEQRVIELSSQEEDVEITKLHLK